jgi:hypothetical protein
MFRKGKDAMKHYTRDEWYQWPSDLRVRWLEETKFDRLPPSAALLAEIERNRTSWQSAAIADRKENQNG